MTDEHGRRRDRATGPRPADPPVGRWVVIRGGHLDDQVGVLASAEPQGLRPDGAPDWRWVLRTPAGSLSGGGGLPADPLTRHHADQVRRVRRELRGHQAALHSLAGGGDRSIQRSLARVSGDLELLEAQVACRTPSPRDLRDDGSRGRGATRG